MVTAMKTVIEAIENAGMRDRVKVMVGGARSPRSTRDPSEPTAMAAMQVKRRAGQAAHRRGQLNESLRHDEYGLDIQPRPPSTLSLSGHSTIVSTQA